MKTKIVGILVVTLLIVSCMTVASMALEKLNPITLDNSRQSDGNTLITEFDRVIEVDSGGSIVWKITGLYGGPVDAERLNNGNTLITEGDIGLGRVIEVDSGGSIVWEKTGLYGGPVDAERLDNGNTLITEVMMRRVIEVDSGGSIVWEKTGVVWPTDAERLDNGNTLITSSAEGRVIEVDSGGSIVWKITGLYGGLVDAERLNNGNTLITEGDIGLGRVIEVDSGGSIVWEKTGLYGGLVDAERLDNGNTLITEVMMGRVIEVDSGGSIVWEKTGLYGPWDAERIVSINAPNAPKITGEANGKKGTRYEYTFNAVDPNGDNVKYHIDWGDGDSETTGYSDSGTDVKVKHTWTEEGTYTIKATAEDANGLIGPEGTLSVTMTRDKLLPHTFFMRLFERFPNAFPILRHLMGL